MVNKRLKTLLLNERMAFNLDRTLKSEYSKTSWDTASWDTDLDGTLF